MDDVGTQTIRQITAEYDAQIERLTAEREVLQEYKRKQMEDIITLGQEVGKLTAERDRLQQKLAGCPVCDEKLDNMPMESVDVLATHRLRSARWK